MNFLSSAGFYWQSVRRRWITKAMKTIFLAAALITFGAGSFTIPVYGLAAK